MTFENYVRVIHGVHAELKRLVESTANGGLGDTARASQAELEILIQRHVDLVKYSTQLTERVFTRYKAGR